MLREMYFGKVIPWERKNRKCAEQAEVVKKIEDEERYFIQKMSLYENGGENHPLSRLKHRFRGRWYKTLATPQNGKRERIKSL